MKINCNTMKTNQNVFIAQQQLIIWWTDAYFLRIKYQISVLHEKKTGWFLKFNLIIRKTNIS